MRAEHAPSSPRPYCASQRRSACEVIGIGDAQRLARLLRRSRGSLWKARPRGPGWLARNARVTCRVRAQLGWTYTASVCKHNQAVSYFDSICGRDQTTAAVVLGVLIDVDQHDGAAPTRAANRLRLHRPPRRQGRTGGRAWSRGQAVASLNLADLPPTPG